MKRIDVDREYGVAPPGYRLPELTHVGRIRLQVSNLDRSVRYYRDILGFDSRTIDSNTVVLAAHGAEDHLIELHHVPGTTPVPPNGVLGLYHFAILLPSRELLGQFVRHLIDLRVQFGSADHLVSEAIYLWDPDGLGIEVYADRPRDAWRTNGLELMMATDRLDLRSLIDAAGATPGGAPDARTLRVGVPWAGMPAGTTMGHMHLSVGDLDAARGFYHAGLGLEMVVWSYPGALFMSAGGYHHHLGTNTWAAGARIAAAHDAKLLEWELVLPSASDVAAAAAHMEGAGFPGSNVPAGLKPTPSKDLASDAANCVITDPWQVSLRLSSP